MSENDASWLAHWLLPLDVAVMDPPNGPGPIVVFRGRAAGWSAVHTIHRVVTRMFRNEPQDRPMFNLLECTGADPRCLLMLAALFEDACHARKSFRVLMREPICQNLAPLL